MAVSLLAASVFFVVLGFGLLLKYRQVSQRISTSADLGRDLWSALDQRLKKQDERILDMMGKFEVIQSRVTDRLAAQPLAGVHQVRVPEEKPQVVEPKVAATRVEVQAGLDPTEKTVIKLLGSGPKSSVEIKELVGRSREHTARLMKNLFDRGLVARDDSKKPFLYELSAAGRRYLSAS